MRLAGKVAIISGAASGMGAATARMLAREGAKVVIADVLEHEGRQVADAVGAAARFEPLDVTREEDWAAVVAATTRHFGKLDVLVNNAGISGSAEQDFYSTEAWNRIMAVNATGVFFGIKYAIPAMVATGGARSSISRRLLESSAASTFTWPTTSRRRGTADHQNRSRCSTPRTRSAPTRFIPALCRRCAHPVAPPILPCGPNACASFLCAGREKLTRWRTPFCSWRPMSRPTSQVRKSTSTAELSL